MTNQRRYALIGLFVTGALIISAIGLAVFFGGGFGRGKLTALMVFRGNVTGLEIGTTVQFRGMKIGEVKRVRTIYHPDDKQVLFPVYAEFTGTIEVPGYDRKATSNVRTAWLHEMVDRGLRAQLQTKSFVTGQQMIMLDFVDDQAPVYTRLEGDLLEIPTVRSPNEAIFETIKELPVREMIIDGQKLLANINKLLADDNGKPGSLATMLADLSSLSRKLDQQLPPLLAELQQTGKTTRATMADAQKTLATIASATRSVEQQVNLAGPAFQASAQELQILARSARSSAAELDRLMGRVDQSMLRLEHTLSEDAPLGYALTSGLSEIGAAAKSLRSVADGLSRRPESLIFGRSADRKPTP